MRKFYFLILFVCFLGGFIAPVYSAEHKMSDVFVFSEKNKFGLKEKSTEEIIVEAKYDKFIRLGETSWIIKRKNKFGLMDSDGNYLVEPKYSHCERVFVSFAKLGNDKDFGLHDETGKEIIPHEYSQIEPTFGKMFVTCKKYKYGLMDYSGNVILRNVFDEIYMPSPTALRLKYDDEWYELEARRKDDINMPKGIDTQFFANDDFTITNVVINTGVVSGYSVITFTDYLLKVFSTISPAYEATIDELMFSKGADTIPVIMKFTWLPKFPVVYTKKYFNYFGCPTNGILYGTKSNLKQMIK
ncbi:MAG: WG repeat-containing protein [bacterium]|nr:WG repeat-containing protein [bacterium]